MASGGGDLAIQDSELLQRGAQLAIKKKLLPEAVQVEPVRRIQLTGNSVDSAAGEIVATIGTAAAAGCVVVLQGPAGEQKTAVMQALRQELPKAEAWPVHTFFRAMTFLLLTFAEQTGSSLQDVLQKPEMLGAGVEMIEEMRDGRSIGAMAEDAERMMAMSSDGQKIAESMPLALEYGQGEVVNFVQASLAKIHGTGVTVLLEGPAEILKYIRTPFRFQL